MFRKSSAFQSLHCISMVNCVCKVISLISPAHGMLPKSNPEAHFPSWFTLTQSRQGQPSWLKWPKYLDWPCQTRQVVGWWLLDGIGMFPLACMGSISEWSDFLWFLEKFQENQKKYYKGPQARCDRWPAMSSRCRQLDWSRAMDCFRDLAIG